jgi:hypothetical protein
MKLASLIVEELDREAELTRRALEQVPTGKIMPSWISMNVDQDELDIKPQKGSNNGSRPQV